jgi:hypothetical protein
LRYIDVSSDLAFLFMDLTRLGAEDRARELLAGYREAGGDPGDGAPFSYYAAYRAWVRAKVALLRAAELGGADPERAESEAEEARRLLRLGRQLAWGARRPLIVAVCGVAASGKTSLATELAGLSGLEHLSSDVTRKRLAGIEPTETAGPEHYTPELTRTTYRELGRAARAALGSGGAIVDATFHLRAERAAFLDGLGPAQAPAVFVHCEAPVETLVERAATRAASAEAVSDADAQVVRRQLDEEEPLDEIPLSGRASVETDVPPQRLAARVEHLIDARIWDSGAWTPRREPGR